jgi:hypothetical protein
MHATASQPAGRSGAIMTDSLTHTGTISNNTIFLDGTVFETYGIALWNANQWTIASNKIHITGVYSRAILMDGSNSNSVSNNQILIDTPKSTIAANNTGSGIRVRFSSSNNVFTANRVDVTGFYSTAVFIGGTEPSSGHPTRPTDNVFVNNFFRSTYDAVYFQEGGYTEFRGNTITNLSTSGFAVLMYDTAITPAVHFANDTITGVNTSICGAQTPCLVAAQSNVTGLTFCGVAITSSQLWVRSGDTMSSSIAKTCPAAPAPAPSPTSVQ